MLEDSAHAQAIASYANFVRGNYFTVAARALFLWDYLVTLDMEVNYVWGQKLSAASGLFILNRYTNLLITILELIEQAPFETPQRYASCYSPFDPDELKPEHTAALRSYAYCSQC
ncbi:hypothetical protein VTO73DRAFT_11175 [Trametes versicolor]